MRKLVDSLSQMDRRNGKEYSFVYIFWLISTRLSFSELVSEE